MVRIRQKDVFGSKNDPGIEIYLVNSIILCYAVGMHICVYMYYEYLKNVQMYATEGSSYTNIIARQNHFSINMIARKSIKGLVTATMKGISFTFLYHCQQLRTGIRLEADFPL